MTLRDALIGLAVVGALYGCATPDRGPLVPRLRQTDEQRCTERGAHWTLLAGVWHCLATPVTR